MDLRFDGRVAIVTGAGAGLGRAYAEWLAARGAKIVVNNRAKEGAASPAADVARAINAAGGEAVAEESAVESPGAGAALVATALERFGRVDIVIANAGATQRAPVLETAPDAFHAIMNVNFWGAASLALAALPHFVEAGYGRILFTTSAVALFGQSGYAPYGAAKGALVGFMRSLAVEFGKEDIRINAVSPYARTRMSQHAIDEAYTDLMSPAKVAPIVGALVHESCERSGVILSAGAGRVRKATMVESAPVAFAEGPLAPVWPALDDLNGAVASRNSGRSALELAPELRAAGDQRGGPKRTSPNY